MTSEGDPAIVCHATGTYSIPAVNIMRYHYTVRAETALYLAGVSAPLAGLKFIDNG